MGKIMYFIFGIILSFLWNHDRITYNIKYKEKSNSILIRKSLPLTNKDNKNQ